MNPIEGIIKSARGALLGTFPINWPQLIISATACLFMLLIGLYISKKPKRPWQTLSDNFMGNIIEVKNLGKEYKICHQSASYKTLRDNLADFFRQPVRTIRDSRQAKREKFWALEEIDFSVGEGGVVGVMGPMAPANRLCSRFYRGLPCRQPAGRG